MFTVFLLVDIFSVGHFLYVGDGFLTIFQNTFSIYTKSKKTKSKINPCYLNASYVQSPHF